jgi:cell division protein FtsB
MERTEAEIQTILTTPDFDPEQQGSQFWYEQYLQQRAENQQLRQEIAALKAQVEQLQEGLRKIS